MLVKILIILFTTLPPALAVAAQSEQAVRADVVTKHLRSHPNDSNALYNLALVEQKRGMPALALALTERSRFLNPLNFDAIDLGSLSYDQLSDQNNERPLPVPLIFKVLDFIPYALILGLTVCSFLYFAWRLGKTIQLEISSFKSQPHLRLQTSIVAGLAMLMLGLAWLKSESSNQVWACVTKNEAGLFTGPSTTYFAKVGSLSSGSCSKVVRSEQGWLSLSPSNRTPGWIKKTEVLIVRANKFDPLFK